tara:strand:- start:96 stop:524 length:429 start_codon:yes stop_codon:yes gene_type:complete
MSESYVLYINVSYSSPSDYCAGSTRCIEHVKDRKDVLVQSVASILSQGIALPAWLDATPCVVDTQSGTAYKGTRAVEFCAQLGPETGAALETLAEEEVVVEDDNRKVTEADVEKLLKRRQQQDEALGQAPIAAAPIAMPQRE